MTFLNNNDFKFLIIYLELKFTNKTIKAKHVIRKCFKNVVIISFELHLSKRLILRKLRSQNLDIFNYHLRIS